MIRERFTLTEMIYISLLATIATVSKVPIRALSNLMTSSVGLPGGIVGGVYYMFWIVAACAIVRKHGVATLFCVLQIFVSLATSNMPIIKLITYLPPGIAIDLFLLLRRSSEYNKGVLMFLGAIANCAGAATQAMVIMNLPLIATLVSCLTALVSGSVGGYLAYLVVLRIVHAVGKKVN
ncbi:MAG: ECF transporter S component [Tissierellia bacterium]|nr:ECF transporter S component [Tissierellia bacterium]